MMTITECMQELTREITVRSYVYPKMIDNGKLTQDEADLRMRRMEDARQHLSNYRHDLARGYLPTTGN